MPDNPNINLDRVGGTKQSAANIVDNPNQALRVNVVAGGGGGGGPATIADGADVVEGTLADAAITSDANGTVSGKLRGLVKILASVWDSVNGRLKVDGSAVTQPVSGTITADQGAAGAFAWPIAISQAGTDSTVVATQPTGTNLHAVIDSGVITTITNQVDTNLKQVGGSNVVAAAAGVQKVGVADGSGTAITSTAAALDINIKSGSIANTAFGVNNGAGAAAVNIQDGGNAITVDGAVSVSNLPATQDVNLTQVSGAAVVLGQATMAASVPVVLPSDQTVPVSGSVTAIAEGLFAVAPTALANGDSAQLALDDLGRLRVVTEDSPKVRRLLEMVLMELQVLNSNFRESNSSRVKFSETN